MHLHHDRQAIEGEGRRTQGLWRRSHRLPQRRSRRSALVLSVSSRLERETPNSWKASPCDNLSNTAAHYEQTGPEIWDQTEGKVDHLVVGVGTGGTICGVAKYSRSASRRQGVGHRHLRIGFKSTKRRASSIRTRSTRTSLRASAKTSCPRTSTSRSSTASRRSPIATPPS